MMHIPVLQKEVMEYLDVKPNENFIDATFGQGGHSFAILERTGPEGKILGIDRDCKILESAKQKTENAGYKNRIIFFCDNFSNLKNIVKKTNFKPVSGILLDLGMSSWHLEESKRGFSFQRNEPLDMRYDAEVQSLTAEIIVNDWPEKEIEKILKEYGEERFARNISRKIIETRKLKPIKTTLQLTEIIKKSFPGRYPGQKINFATRTFQALRIAVNDELNNLKKALPQVIEILEKGGRMVVISFHSLEDKIVKNFLKENSKGHLAERSEGEDEAKLHRLKILTKKPVRPSIKEGKINPRSRSARLRAAVKGR